MSDRSGRSGQIQLKHNKDNSVPSSARHVTHGHQCVTKGFARRKCRHWGSHAVVWIVLCVFEPNCTVHPKVEKTSAWWKFAALECCLITNIGRSWVKMLIVDHRPQHLVNNHVVNFAFQTVVHPHVQTTFQNALVLFGLGKTNWQLGSVLDTVVGMTGSPRFDHKTSMSGANLAGRRSRTHGLLNLWKTNKLSNAFLTCMQSLYTNSRRS